MRMNLYQCTIIDAFGKSRRHVVAPSEQCASEFIKEYYYSIGEQPTMISAHRIDDTLEGEHRDGLDSLLHNAPIGFAIEAAIGWIAHASVKQELRLFRIESEHRSEVFVVAPNADVASAIYAFDLPPSERADHKFKIIDAIADMPGDRISGVRNLLELGPIGIAKFSSASGWSVH